MRKCIKNDEKLDFFYDVDWSFLCTINYDVENLKLSNSIYHLNYEQTLVNKNSKAKFLKYCHVHIKYSLFVKHWEQFPI